MVPQINWIITVTVVLWVIWTEGRYFLLFIVTWSNHIVFCVWLSLQCGPLKEKCFVSPAYYYNRTLSSYISKFGTFWVSSSLHDILCYLIHPVTLWPAYWGCSPHSQFHCYLMVLSPSVLIISPRYLSLLASKLSCNFLAFTVSSFFLICNFISSFFYLPQFRNFYLSSLNSYFMFFIQS